MQVNKVIPMRKIANELTESLKIQISKEKISSEKLILLKDVLKNYEGNIPVFINLTENGSDKGKLFSLQEIRIKITNELLKSLTELFGEESVILKAK
jgi:hypothetical protein